MDTDTGGGFCRKCGKPLTREDEFCSSCGTQVIKEYVQNESPPVRENPPENVPPEVTTPPTAEPPKNFDIKTKYIIGGTGIFFVALMLIMKDSLVGLLCPMFSLGVVAIIISIIVSQKKVDEKRRMEWRDFAKRHGFTYLQDDSIGLLERFTDYGFRGEKKKMYNICLGREKDRDICTFDYQVTVATGRGQERKTIYETCIAVDTSLVFRYPLYVLFCGASFFKSLAAFGDTAVEISHPNSETSTVFEPSLFELARILGKFPNRRGLDFESAEFSKKYYVKCEDKKFSYDIIHPQMIEFILNLPRQGTTMLSMTARSQTVIFKFVHSLTNTTNYWDRFKKAQQDQWKTYRVSAQQMDNFLICAHKFFDLIPDYVKEENSL